MGTPRRWIRLDVGWEDSWLDDLTGAAAGCWPRLLCWVKRDGKGGRCKRPKTSKLARTWRVTEADVEELEAAAIADHALLIEDGEWVIANWSQYQEPDPTATERKRKQRANGHDVSRTSRRDNRDTWRDPSRDHRPPTETNNPPAADAAVPPAAAMEALTLLGNGGAEALEAMRPPGGMRAVLASIRDGFLYEFEDQSTLPDASVKGLPLPERRQYVARALVDMRSRGWQWSPQGLSGYVRTLRSQPQARAPTAEAAELTRAQYAKYREIRRELEDGGMPAEEAAEEADRRARA